MAGALHQDLQPLQSNITLILKMLLCILLDIVLVHLRVMRVAQLSAGRQ